MSFLDFERHVSNIERIVCSTDELMEGNCMYLHQTFNRDPNMIPKQRNLVKAVKNKKTILEIGFNAGHSALIFLLSNPNATMMIFDLGEHSYSKLCFEYLDKEFPNRLEIIWGDSTIQLPLYITQHNQQKFDLIHIDGGHSDYVCRSDILYARLLAHPETWMILDDISLPPIFKIYKELCKTILTPIAKVFEQTAPWGHQLCKYRIAHVALLYHFNQLDMSYVDYCAKHYYDLEKLSFETEYDIIIWMSPGTIIENLEFEIYYAPHNDIVVLGDDLKNDTLVVRNNEWSKRFLQTGRRGETVDEIAQSHILYIRPVNGVYRKSVDKIAVLD